MSSKKKPTKEELIGARTNAKGLYQYAEIYWKAYNELVDLSKGTAAYYPADYFLATRSIELSLKCILRAKGATLDELSSKFSHDLNKLVKQVCDKGYVEISDKEKEVIDIVNTLYKTKQFEYKVIGSKSLPKDEDLELVCVTILEKAKPFADNDNSFKEYLKANNL